MIYPLKAQWLL